MNRQSLALAILAIAIASCSDVMRAPAIPALPYRSSAVPGLVKVGTARVDVTPPPGPTTFGHGPDALAAFGYWSRLYCRVFVFEPTTSPEDRIAIVPCDLGAISLALSRAVGERVERTVHPSRIMLTATHTHAGPAHYFENGAYQGVLSTRLPGFDKAMLDFMAERIAAGIELAAKNLVPAKVRWEHASVWGLSRNRSLLAFQSNPHPMVPDDPLPPDFDKPEEWKAIDPALDVLQIETTEAPSRSIGWLVFFAMHPTVLPAHNRLFGGDAFAVASRVLESELRRKWGAAGFKPCVGPEGPECPEGPREPLAGIVNTNEGDMSPEWVVGNVAECIRVGTSLAAKAWKTDASPATWKDSFVLNSRYEEVSLEQAKLNSACRMAELGQAAGRGGSDHACSLDGLVLQGPDATTNRTDGQEPKTPLLGSLQPYLVSPYGFPRYVPLAVVRLDETWLSFVPAEMTITAGALVRSQVKRVLTAFGHPLGRAIVAGLANAYMLYVATSDEYELQKYEGGSTLYGPKTAEFLAGRFGALVRAMEDGQDSRSSLGLIRALRYRATATRQRFPERTEAEPKREQLGLCRVQALSPMAVCFWWSDAKPGGAALTSAPWIRLFAHDAPATTCGSSLDGKGSCDGAGFIDDRGLDFRTRARGSFDNRYVWSTLFVPSSDEWTLLAPDDPLELRIRGGEGVSDLRSKAFTKSNPPPPCPPEQVRYCMDL